MMKEISFRIATEEDRSFIWQLSAGVFSIYGDYDGILAHWFLQPGVITVISSINDHPVGFAMLQVGEREDPDTSTGELLAIAVKPAHQGQGVGQALLARMEDFAGQYGLSKILLHTAQGNIPARSLFRKAGYRIVESRARFYPRGQTALMMVKALTHEGSIER